MHVCLPSIVASVCGFEVYITHGIRGLIFSYAPEFKGVRVDDVVQQYFGIQVLHITSTSLCPSKSFGNTVSSAELFKFLTKRTL